MNVFLCSTGFEAALVDECGGTMVCPGVVAAERSGDFVFARQILPDATRVHAPSITQLASPSITFTCGTRSLNLAGARLVQRSSGSDRWVSTSMIL